MGGGVGLGEGSVDAPPQRGGCVVVGQWALAGGGADEPGRVQPVAGQCGEVFGELVGEVVAVDRRVEVGEQGCPFGHCWCESLA